MICHKSDSDSINICVDYLKNNKIVIIPTDTVYGFSSIAGPDIITAKKIMQIKGREENKQFIQLISSPDDIQKYTQDKIPSKLLDYWPGPLTIIVNDNRLENSYETTTAFRCPGDLWLRQIISNLEYPIYSTSANKSGCKILDTEKDILLQFQDSVDLIVLDGDKKNSVPSTIVKIENGQVKVLREGAVKL